MGLSGGGWVGVWRGLRGEFVDGDGMGLVLWRVSRLG